MNSTLCWLGRHVEEPDLRTQLHEPMTNKGKTNEMRSKEKLALTYYGSRQQAHKRWHYIQSKD